MKVDAQILPFLSTATPRGHTLLGPIGIVVRMHSSAWPKNSLASLGSITPSPLASLEVSITPLWLRSTQWLRLPENLESVPWLPNARLMIQTSPLLSTATRPGQLPWFDQLQYSRGERAPVGCPLMVTSAES